ncbi:uncharacterized protein LOC143229591 [Tachypleus tridentatus]|uniref:uncharacterized protein LOC143229591 n=1 Tax=Tachypleus tridentatus TaxID=6853 RepID=UPI003FD14F0F
MLPQGGCSFSRNFNMNEKHIFNNEKNVIEGSMWFVVSKSDLIMHVVFQLFCGILCGVLSVLLRDLGPVQVMGIRCLFQAIFLIPILLLLKIRVFYDGLAAAMLTLRTIWGTITLIMFYAGFYFLSTEEVFFIYFTQPIYASIMSCLVLDEDCTISHIFVILVNLVGILVILSPLQVVNDYQNFTSEAGKVNHYVAVIIGMLVSSIGEGVIRLILHRLQEVDTTAVIFWWSLTAGSSILLFTALNETWETKCTEFEFLAIFLMGVLVLMSHTSLTVAILFNQTAAITVATSTETVVVYILRATLFRQPLKLIYKF